jgi:predicted choloylglycine hydrolase
MAYNVTVVDRSGDHFTAFLGPDRAPGFSRQRFATNHQEHLDWPQQAHATHSVERAAVLADLLVQPVDRPSLVDRFLSPPLYSTGYDMGFGTLYTAVYSAASGSIEYRWPGSVRPHTLPGFATGQHQVALGSYAPM